MSEIRSQWSEVRGEMPDIEAHWVRAMGAKSAKGPWKTEIGLIEERARNNPDRPTMATSISR
jgi:hypothetical protein